MNYLKSLVEVAGAKSAAGRVTMCECNETSCDWVIFDADVVSTVLSRLMHGGVVDSSNSPGPELRNIQTVVGQQTGSNN